MGWPTKRALALPSVPKFYQHDEALVGSRRAQYVESVYEAINAAGARAAGGGAAVELDEAGTAAMVAEATESFKLNAAIYAEDGRDSRFTAYFGGLRALGGYAAERFWGPPEPRDIFGRLVRRRRS